MTHIFNIVLRKPDAASIYATKHATVSMKEESYVIFFHHHSIVKQTFLCITKQINKSKKGCTHQKHDWITSGCILKCHRSAIPNQIFENSWVSILVSPSLHLENNQHVYRSIIACAIANQYFPNKMQGNQYMNFSSIKF